MLKKRETAARRESIRKSQINEIVSLIAATFIASRRLEPGGQNTVSPFLVVHVRRSHLSHWLCAKQEFPSALSNSKVCATGRRFSMRVALTRALFNPEDRVAWLGVLRARWCGLSLAELHTIAGHR